MKKGWKIFWVICGMIFCLGAVFYIAGRLLGFSFYEAAAVLDNGHGILPGLLYWDEDDLGDGMKVTSKITDHREYGYGERAEEPGFKKNYTGIRKVEVDAAGIQLQILESPDKNVYVEAVNVDEKLCFNCVQNREELDITTTKNFHALNQIKGYATVWLLLPKEQLAELELCNDAGEVYVEDVAAAEFTLDVGAGSAEIDNFTAQKAELACGAGEITAKGAVLSEGDIECGVGEITLTLQGYETDYTYDVECGIGEVTIGGQYYSGIGISRSGDDDDDYEHDHDDDAGHHNTANRGGKELSIECGIGSVSVDFTER